ncbi:hypothetical protein [Glycomyces tenuis]|uniref:hypothetical protein n=1 Tax=Glycomyces tenuis TaxID=58116 RepID=UPI0003F7C152|nr:hypothetical protein [Glycomyces tenuis]
MRWIRLGLVAAFLLAAAASALAGGLARGGGEPASAQPVPPSAPPELSATAEIRRSFLEPGTVAIAVTNHGPAPVRVTGVELRSDSFAPLGTQAFDATVPPSVNPRDLLTDYGAAQCPDGVDSTAAPSSVLLDVETEDGTAHQVLAELPHPNGVLDRLLKEACAAEFLAQNAEVALGELVRAADGTLDAALTVEAVGDAAVEATEVRGSVLFEITASELPGRAVGLHFDAHRCEGHAVGDAKQPFAFTVWIAVDGGEPVPGPVPVGEAQREALYAMLDERCGHTED